VRARQRADVACGSNVGAPGDDLVYRNAEQITKEGGMADLLRACASVFAGTDHCASVGDQHRRRPKGVRRKLRRKPVDQIGGERAPPSGLLTRGGGRRVRLAWTNCPLWPGSCVLVTSCRGLES
jgi:hypothetical protein